MKKKKHQIFFNLIAQSIIITCVTQSFTDVVAINILWSVCIVHTQVEQLLPAFKKQGGGATGSTLITTFIQSNMCETAGEGGVGGGASYANSMQTVCV